MSLAAGTLLSATAQAAPSAAGDKAQASPLTSYRVGEVSRRVSLSVGSELATRGETMLYRRPLAETFYVYTLASSKVSPPAASAAKPATQNAASERTAASKLPRTQKVNVRVLLAQEQTNTPAAAPEDPTRPPALTVPVGPEDEGEAPAPNPPADNAAEGTAPAAGAAAGGAATGGAATGGMVEGATGGTLVTPDAPTTPEAGAIGSAAEAEGRPVAEVRVVGNRVVPTETILLQATGTRPGAALSTRQLELDRQKIDALGFFASVQYQVFPNLEDPNRIDVVFTVIENRVVTGFQFEGNTQITSADLEKVLETRRGAVLNRNMINTDVEKIQGLYRERGFFGLVSESRQLENGTVLYTVREAQVSRIDLSGLKKTRESLVRRMIRTKPGDTFDQTRIRQDLNRIYDMGFFEDVSFKVADDPDKPGSVIVTLVLKEKRTGQLNLGVGFDNRSNITGFAGVGESNFRGSGRSVNASIELGGRRSFQLGFANPFIGKNNATFSASVYDQTTFREPRSVGTVLGGDKSATYEEHRTGARANFTLPLDQDRVNSFLIGLRAENAELSQQTDKKTTTTTLPVNADGTIAALSAGFIRDTRDLRLDPSRGFRFQAIVERTLPGISSDFNFTRIQQIDPGTGVPVPTPVRASRPTSFTKLDIDMRNYFPLLRGAKVEDPAKLVFASRLVIGRALGELPPFEQYFIGGSDTVRGFEDEVQFGDNQIFANLELRYRFNRQFQFVGFADAGSASGGLFRSATSGLLSSAGIGLRVRTPIGPIRLDIARPFSGGDGGFKTHFGIGSTF